MASSNQYLGGGTGNLTGSVYDYSDTYGGKYNVPDPSSSSAAAISGTASNLGSLSNLSAEANKASAQQAVETQDITTPGYSTNMAKWSQDISDLLSGKISSGAIYSMEQAAAESGISTGLSGSQTNQSSLLRALGLTSESLMKEGASQLAAQKAASVSYTPFDMSQYYTSAADQQAAQTAANTIASAADPASAASAASAAAKSGLSTGLSSAGTTSSSPSTGSSIASLLSSILGSGQGGGAGTIVGNSTSGNSIQSAINSILGTTTSTGNTGIAGWDSQEGDSISGGAQDYYNGGYDSSYQPYEGYDDSEYY